MPHKRGAKRNEENYMCKLSNYEISEIRAIAAKKAFSQKEMAKLFKVTQSCISRVVNNNRRANAAA